jgi:inhibitor of cysteine peptidase
MNRRSMIAFAAVAVAVALLLVAGCAKPQPTVLGEKDAGRVVEIGAGQQFTVRLPSNATTGFRWVVADLGTATQVGESVYEAPQAPGVVGAGGTELLTFKTGASGPSELKLEYRRPWEKAAPAEKTWSVTVK